MNITPHFPRLIGPLVVAFAVAGGPAVASTSVSPASAASTTTATGCASTAHWGSLATSLNRMTSAPITNVRAGRQTCFDRLVVDLRGKSSGYTVRYVPRLLRQGQGTVIPLRGSAKLEIVLQAPAYDAATGSSTYSPANTRELVNVTGFSTFRQIASGGSFEGSTTVGLGVRARLPMRVSVLGGPGISSRVVVDVAHHW